MTPKPKFTEGEKVLCFHGPLIYEAKCLKVQSKDKQTRYQIHYAGWKKSWDEWVPESRVLKLNDQNIIKQKDLLKAHEVQLKSKKGKKSLEKRKSLPLKESGGNNSDPEDSRSSTPTTDRSLNSKRSTIIPLVAKSSDEGEPKKKKAKVDQAVESEEQFTTTLEIKIKLPDELKPVLVDDWDLINRQKRLPIVPCKLSVDAILSDFTENRINSKNNSLNRESAIQEVVAGLKEYFNVMLGTQLLYKFERLQYADALKEHPDQQMSSVYGFVHLTRLFVRLGQMLVYTQLDDRSINLLNCHLQEFLRFMVKNMNTYYSIQDYGVAAPEYQRKAI